MAYKILNATETRNKELKTLIYFKFIKSETFISFIRTIFTQQKQAIFTYY